jgi:hypothetical protein
MKYIKTFERIREVDLVASPKWHEYVIGLFNEYLKIYDEEDSDLYPAEVVEVFDDLDDEIDESQEIEVWVVEHKIGKGFHFGGLAKAYGPIHARVKVAIATNWADCITEESTETYMPEDGDIENKIDQLNDKIENIKAVIEQWKTIY